MDTSSLICDSPIALIEEIDGPERMCDILLVIDWEAETITALAEEIVDNARLENVVVLGGPAAVAQYLRGLRDELPAPGPHTFSMQGHEIVEKTARASGTTARVLVPVSWVGCRVAVIRLEEKR